jgi:hypothetical protein
MKNTLLALFIVPLLTLPAFAGSSNAGDKPMVVAQAVEVGVGGVGVGVGLRHRHHRDHAVVLDREHHHHHDDRR